METSYNTLYTVHLAVTQDQGCSNPSNLYLSEKYPNNTLFTSFSGHRPAQRECTRTGLRSHAGCNPYPIPQPVKVGYTTGVYNPYSFREVIWVLLRPTITN